MPPYANGNFCAVYRQKETFFACQTFPFGLHIVILNEKAKQKGGQMDAAKKYVALFRPAKSVPVRRNAAKSVCREPPGRAGHARAIQSRRANAGISG